MWLAAHYDIAVDSYAMLFLKRVECTQLTIQFMYSLILQMNAVDLFVISALVVS